MSTTTSPVAIVTGASSGIGLGIAQALAKAGYRLVGTSRSASSSKELNALQSGQNLILVDGDIGLKQTAVKVAAAAVEKFGRIDLLVNNAGMFMPKPFTEYSEEDFAQMISTNVASFFFMTQQVLPQMCKQKSSHVASISTTLVDQPLAGRPAGLPVLTKSTMPALGKALAIEYADFDIRFNTISPGIVKTPMHDEANYKELEDFSPLKRLADISDIVDALVYLESAKLVTGENLRVDGGAHAGRW